jgi:hypothetical protein
VCREHLMVGFQHICQGQCAILDSQSARIHDRNVTPDLPYAIGT